MACGCTANKIIGGKRRKSRRKQRRRRSRRTMSGGANVSLLGNQTTDIWNYTSKLLGTPGVPSMPWNQPANFSYRYGNSYVV